MDYQQPEILRLQLHVGSEPVSAIPFLCQIAGSFFFKSSYDKKDVFLIRGYISSCLKRERHGDCSLLSPTESRQWVRN